MGFFRPYAPRCGPIPIKRHELEFDHRHVFWFALNHSAPTFFCDIQSFFFCDMELDFCNFWTKNPRTHATCWKKRHHGSRVVHHRKKCGKSSKKCRLFRPRGKRGRSATNSHNVEDTRVFPLRLDERARICSKRCSVLAHKVFKL